MSRPLPSYFDLGATLYTPCSHARLPKLLDVGISGVRSMVFCLEDAVSEADLPQALANLKRSLAQLEASPSHRYLRFVRPRNVAMLGELLQWPDIDKLDGFVLPKADLNTLPGYLLVLSRHARRRFALMPTLESEQVLDFRALPALRQKIAELGDAVIAIRTGGNDLMALLGLKRLPGVSLYETPLRTLLDHLVLAFRPHGYELASPVFDCIDDHQTLLREVIHDLSYGFFAKTAVHPLQVPLIETAYAEFALSHSERAERVLDQASAAVFCFEGEMVEPVCHTNWARRIRSLVDVSSIYTS